MSIFNNVSNDDLNQERVSKISGLSYYKNFITKDEEEYLLNYLPNIEYTKELNRYIKYYGFNYSYKKSKSDVKAYTGEIPNELNIIKDKLDIKMNQLVIEYLPVGKGYSFPIHSSIFDDNIITIPLGSDFVAEFENKLTNEKYEILIKRRSLIVLSGECRKKWSYKIKSNKYQVFNQTKLKRRDKYILTFKNIKLINKEIDDDKYYFTY